MGAFAKGLVVAGTIAGALAIARATREKPKRKKPTPKGRQAAAVAPALERGATLTQAIKDELYQGPELAGIPGSWRNDLYAYAKRWPDLPPVYSRTLNLTPEAQGAAWDYMLYLVDKHGYDLSDPTSLQEATVRALSKVVAPDGDWYAFAYDGNGWTNPPEEFQLLWDGTAALGELAHANLWTIRWVGDAFPLEVQGERLQDGQLLEAFKNYYALDRDALMTADGEALNEEAFCGIYPAYPLDDLFAQKYTVSVRLAEAIDHALRYLEVVQAGIDALDAGPVRDELDARADATRVQLRQSRRVLVSAAEHIAHGEYAPLKPPAELQSKCSAQWIYTSAWQPLFEGGITSEDWWGPHHMEWLEGRPVIEAPYWIGDALLAEANSAG